MAAQPDFKALGIGCMVVSVTLLVGGITPLWVQDVGLIFGGIAIAMFICHGIDWLRGEYPLPVKRK